MKPIALALALLASPHLAAAGHHSGGGGHSHATPTGTGVSPHSHVVRGYTKKNGTYVAPHRQTDPDGTQRNNYSTKGNTNPWTGKAGTQTATH